MRKYSDFMEAADSMFTDAVRRGLMHQDIDDTTLDGRTIQIAGRDLISFSSCSYLGLELDPRLKQGAIDAVMSYGSQFSCSRVFLSTPQYAELEDLFGQVFGIPALVAPTTTLAHIAAIPTLIQEDDAIILDQQVHNSVQTAVNLARVHGTRVEIVRHNNIEQIEEAIRRLRPHCRNIWYMADGLYSMFGDFAPVAELQELVNRYEQFHLYIDDAHSMSWCGKNGRGHVLDVTEPHDRIVVATSLAKAFGVGGGVLLVKNDEWRRKIRTLGGGLVYSGPIQPPVLGAAIASAKIHLSEEIYRLQDELKVRIQLCNDLTREYRLPIVAPCEAPIRFIGTGLPRVTYNVVGRLIEEGMFTNVGMFPAVPMKRSGIRFTLTRHLSFEDIHRLMEGIARHLPVALKEEGSSYEALVEAFEELKGREAPVPSPPASETELVARIPGALTLQHETSIAALDPAEWDQLLGDRGSFTHEGLKFLEATFNGHAKPEDNWNFHYFVVRNQAGKAILATFFTDALWKDDMIAPEAVSRRIEQQRAQDPYYLTSRTLSMGSMLTEGHHLYLDRSGDWRAALELLISAAGRVQQECGASNLVFRDFPSDDPELDAFMQMQGLAKYLMPDTHVVDVDWQDNEGYMRSLSAKSRYHQRHAVSPWSDAYDVTILDHRSPKPDPALYTHLYRLYLNVKARGLLLNTFDLPATIFEQCLAHPGWELKLLYLKPERDGKAGNLPVGFSLDFVGPEQFVPMVIGLDYDYVTTHGLYRQFLRQAIQRAQEHGKRKIYLGIGASLEKRRFGARVETHCLYAQANDLYNMEVIAQMMVQGSR